MTASDNLSPGQFGDNTWSRYDDLPEHAKNAIRNIRTSWWTHEQAEQNARGSEWQMEHVPTPEMKRRVMADDPDLGHQHGSFDNYHKWYLDAGHHVQDHGTSRWPVIEKHPEDDNEGYLDDGWHRFHSYVRAGDTHIPLLRQRPLKGQS